MGCARRRRHTGIPGCTGGSSRESRRDAALLPGPRRGTGGEPREALRGGSAVPRCHPEHCPAGMLRANPPRGAPGAPARPGGRGQPGGCEPSPGSRGRLRGAGGLQPRGGLCQRPERPGHRRERCRRSGLCARPRSGQPARGMRARGALEGEEGREGRGVRSRPGVAAPLRARRAGGGGSGARPPARPRRPRGSASGRRRLQLARGGRELWGAASGRGAQPSRSPGGRGRPGRGAGLPPKAPRPAEGARREPPRHGRPQGSPQGQPDTADGRTAALPRPRSAGEAAGTRGRRSPPARPPGPAAPPPTRPAHRPQRHAPHAGPRPLGPPRPLGHAYGHAPSALPLAPPAGRRCAPRPKRSRPPTGTPGPPGPPANPAPAALSQD
ncbi:collagen alpha-1(I) chain-like [Passer domesticus]|uniref:collagen alpha-1(I) chain-like n=1 Tax=Passer domesticus TaxID=48849 RepID=UPI0030FEF057